MLPIFLPEDLVVIQVFTGPFGNEERLDTDSRGKRHFTCSHHFPGLALHTGNGFGLVVKGQGPGANQPLHCRRPSTERKLDRIKGITQRSVKIPEELGHAVQCLHLHLTIQNLQFQLILAL